MFPPKVFFFLSFLKMKKKNVKLKQIDNRCTTLPKGQLNSEWVYEVIVSPKMQTKNYKDFYPTKQTRIIAKKTA